MAPGHVSRLNNRNFEKDAAARTRRRAPLHADTENGILSPEVADHVIYRAPKNKKDFQKMKALVKGGVTGIGLTDGIVGTIVQSLSPVENDLLHAMGTGTGVGVQVDEAVDYLMGENLLSIITQDY